MAYKISALEKECEREKAPLFSPLLLGRTLPLLQAGASISVAPMFCTLFKRFLIICCFSCQDHLFFNQTVHNQWCSLCHGCVFPCFMDSATWLHWGHFHQAATLRHRIRLLLRNTDLRGFVAKARCWVKNSDASVSQTAVYQMQYKNCLFSCAAGFWLWYYFYLMTASQLWHMSPVTMGARLL